MKSLPRTLAGLLASFALLSPATAQLGDSGGHLIIGGGYLEEPGTGYFFAQVGWTPYEDASFAHTIFAEGLFHGDDSQLDFIGPGGMVLFSEDADIVFGNVTLNYELELKLLEYASLYAGAGAGAEIVTINDRFDESLDEDINFVGQAFAGLRVHLGETFEASVGVRRIFREDFSLLGDQFSTEDAWGFDIGIGARF